MIDFSKHARRIFQEAIDDYHVKNSIEAKLFNLYRPDQFEYLLYDKCWTDTVQWHVEDEVRDPEIEPRYALKLKRRIDHLNQERTGKVELIDNYFLTKYKGVTPIPGARVNTESPAWALDRLSILALKIWHMRLETERVDASNEHVHKCREKLETLCEQNSDLSRSLNELLQDISEGKKLMKVYKQMKMYNDPNLNPVLYSAIKM